MPVRNDKKRKFITFDKRAEDQLKQLRRIYNLQTSKIIEIAIDQMYHNIKLYDKKAKLGDRPYKKDQKELFKEIYGMDPVDDDPFVKY